MKFFEVGGCVRDELMGKQTKDIDFTVVLEDHERPLHNGNIFEFVCHRLEEMGFTIFEERPQFLTVRAHFPKDHPQFGRTTADFVIARKDGTYSDNRRPDFVEPGDLIDDLNRRDFRMNAIAKDIETNQLIDPHGGRKDIEHCRIRFVGDPQKRIDEDALRAIRGLRFQVTHKMMLDRAAYEVINTEDTAEKIMQLPLDRIQPELHKMFFANTIASITIITRLCWPMQQAIFRENKLKLLPTLGKKVKE